MRSCGTTSSRVILVQQCADRPTKPNGVFGETIPSCEKTLRPETNHTELITQRRVQIGSGSVPVRTLTARKAIPARARTIPQWRKASQRSSCFVGPTKESGRCQSCACDPLCSRIVRMRFRSARNKTPAWSLHVSVLAQPVEVLLGRLGMMAHAGLSLRLAKGDHPRDHHHADEFT